MTTPRLSPPAIKISAAIVRLSEPLRRKYPEPHRVTVVIALTIAAWNLSLVNEAESAELRSRLRDTLPVDLSEAEAAAFLAALDELIERKRRDYPEVKHFIISHSLSSSGQTMNLTVETAPMLPGQGSSYT